MNRLLAVTITVALATAGSSFAQFPQESRDTNTGQNEDQNRAVARISVINGGTAGKSSALLRVLIVLAIFAQGSLFVHYHSIAPVPQTITQQ